MKRWISLALAVILLVPLREGAAYVESALPAAPLPPAKAIAAAEDADANPAADEKIPDAGKETNTSSPAAGWTYLRTIGSDAGYLSADGSVFFACGTADDALPPYTLPKGALRIVLFLAPGTPVVWGVAVGDPAASVLREVGPVYPYSRSDLYENEAPSGAYTENTKSFLRAGRRVDVRYYTLTYSDRRDRHLQFLVGRDAKTVLAAAYWTGPSLSRPDTAAADALDRWGLWRFLFPEPSGEDALSL